MENQPNPDVPQSEEQSITSDEPKKNSRKRLLSNVWIRGITICGSLAAFLAPLGGLILENDQLETVMEPIGAIFSHHSNNREIRGSFRRAQQLYEKNLNLMLTAGAEVQDWKSIEEQWNRAALDLEQVPESHSLYSQSRILLNDCRNYAKYSRALRLASLANQLKSQDENNSLPVETWQRIENLWGEAINNLNAIDSDSRVYELANGKFAKYQQNKQYAQTARAAAPWIQGIRVAQEAANEAAKAETFEDWTKVISLWKTAITLISAVPDEYRNVVQENVIDDALRRYKVSLSQAQQRQLKL